MYKLQFFFTFIYSNDDPLLPVYQAYDIVFNKHENMFEVNVRITKTKKSFTVFNKLWPRTDWSDSNKWMDRLLYNESYIKSCQVVTCHGRTYQQIPILIFLNIYWYWHSVVFRHIAPQCDGHDTQDK